MNDGGGALDPRFRGDDGESPPHLVLVGGGHAHVQVLESLAHGGWPPVRVTLVSPDDHVLYTGMVPGLIQGRYEPRDLIIDLPELCAAANAEFRPVTAERVDLVARELRTTAGILPFDLLSLDIGSIPSGIDRPGVREHAVALRPLDQALAVRDRLDRLAAQSDGKAVRVIVVGAGAGGVEVAFAAQRRLADLQVHASVQLLERGRALLPGHPGRARRLVSALLAERGIATRVGYSVESVDADGVRAEDGSRQDADLVVWLTGPAAPPLLRDSGLPVSPEGYLLVDGMLRSVGGDPVWGAGDCVDLRGVDVPKAGVFAVRQGPVLAANLRAALGDGEPRSYRPQSAYLSLLNTADGRAVLRWRGVVLYGRAAWRLKDWIDRRWVERFRSAHPDEGRT